MVLVLLMIDVGAGPHGPLTRCFMWAFETGFRRGQTVAIDVELGRLPPLAGATTNDACVDIIAAAAAGEIEPTVEIVSPACL